MSSRTVRSAGAGSRLCTVASVMAPSPATDCQVNPSPSKAWPKNGEAVSASRYMALPVVVYSSAAAQKNSSVARESSYAPPPLLSEPGGSMSGCADAAAHAFSAAVRQRPANALSYARQIRAHWAAVAARLSVAVVLGGG